jgi:hypothetical protein
MLVADLSARIMAEVAALSDRVEGAAELTELLRRKALPQASPFAFVLPLGLRARSEGDAATGAFLQMIDELFAVVLIVRSAGDVTGAKALPKIDELVRAVIDAVCGWAPDEAVGVFRLARGQLLAVDAGSVQYQLDFALQQQARILS